MTKHMWFVIIKKINAKKQGNIEDDTKEKEIATPEYIDSLEYSYWK